MAWWTKVVAFAMADLAFLGVINGYFGSYLLLDQKIEIIIAGVAFIPVVLVLSWLSFRKSRVAAGLAAEQMADSMQALSRGLTQGLMRGSQDPVIAAQEWVKKQLIPLSIANWLPTTFQTSSDGSKTVAGTAIANDGQIYGYTVVLTRNNEIATNQSSVHK